MYGFKKFIVKSPQDMSSHWKSLGKGGGCKNAIAFCHCCSCETKDLLKFRENKCIDCENLNKEKCYHWPVADNQTLERTNKELLKLEKEPLHKILTTFDFSTLLTRYNPQELNRFTDKDSVFYNMQGSNREKEVYVRDYLKKDLRALNLPTLVSPKVLQ